MCYSNVRYHIEGLEQKLLEESLLIHLKNLHTFDLKLSALLSTALDISVNKVRKLVESEMITTNPICDIMKYRIKSDMEIYIKPVADFISKELKT